MTTYNIIYDKQHTLQEVITGLQSYGVVINSTFEQLGVLNISSNSTDFIASSFIVMYEVDGTITPEPSFEWHQERLVKAELPLNGSYNPINKGADVIIYLVDSGIDATHPELVDATIINVYSHDGSFDDFSGHGTGMASVIVGKTLGVSPDAILKNVKIGIGTTVTISQLLEAFNAILVDETIGVKVINCSWTIPKSQLLDTKIMELQAAGFVVVAAAGNLIQAADNFSPVGLDTVIGVAASDTYDRVISWGQNAGSNWGPEVDITAPGINVTVADIDDGGTRSASGTSVAAAITSAVVAQFINVYPSLTAQQIQNLVLSDATEDILFRNESIYGTTPNKLLKTLYLNMFSIFDVPVHTLFPVKRGERADIQLTTVYPEILSSIEYKDVIFKNLLRKSMPWISLNTIDAVTTLTINPSEVVEPLKYRIYLTVVDATEIEYIIPYTIGVFVNSPTELDSINTEVYFTNNDTGVPLYITAAEEPCITPAQCPKDSFCVNGICGG